MAADTTRWVALALLNVPLYLGLGWLFFDDWAGFLESLGFWFTPEWFSMFRGELLDNWWNSAKVLVFVLLCGGAVFLEHGLFFEKVPKAQDSFLQPDPSSSPDRTR